MSSVPYTYIPLQTGVLRPLGTKADFHDIVTDQHRPTGGRGDIFAAEGAVRKCMGDPRGKLRYCGDLHRHLLQTMMPGVCGGTMCLPAMWATDGIGGACF